MFPSILAYLYVLHYFSVFLKLHCDVYQLKKPTCCGEFYEIAKVLGFFGKNDLRTFPLERYVVFGNVCRYMLFNRACVVVGIRMTVNVEG